MEYCLNNKFIYVHDDLAELFLGILDIVIENYSEDCFASDEVNADNPTTLHSIVFDLEFQNRICSIVSE